MPLLRLLVVGAEPLFAIVTALAVLMVSPTAAVLTALLALPFTVVGWCTLVGTSALRHPKAWVFPALPALMQASMSLACLLMETRLAIVGMALLAAVAAARYGWHTLVYFHFPERYRPFSLATTSQAVAIITIFFVGFDLLALTTYLNVPVLVTTPGVLVVSGVVAAAGFISYRIPVRRIAGMILAIAILLAELYALVLLLPMLPAVSGGLFALSYYALSGIARLVAEGDAPRKSVIRYATVSIVGIAVILSTARWI